MDLQYKIQLNIDRVPKFHGDRRAQRSCGEIKLKNKTSRVKHKAFRN